MCGIIGGIGCIEARIVIDSLCEMYGRGQDGAGIASFSRKLPSLNKTFGHPTDLYKYINSGKNLDIFVGATRYATSGSKVDSSKSDKEMALPPYNVESNLGLLSLVHNGNVIADLNDYESDSTIIALKFAELLKTNSIENSVKNLMDTLNGAYSIAAIVGSQKLIAFRDPYGIRPLVWGKQDNSYLVASESVILEQSGFEYAGDVNPGELIIFEAGKEPVRRTLLSNGRRHCMFEFTYFSSASSRMEGKYVVDIRRKLGKKLVDLVSENVGLSNIDMVVPVPKTSIPIAEEFSRVSKIPFTYALEKRERATYRTFIGGNKKDRADMINRKYSIMPNSVNEKRILLIDDSIVRGATMEYLIGKFRKAGAVKVHVASATPPIAWPCTYGIDTGRGGKDELVARDRNIEEIERALGADSITYMTLEGLKEAIGMGICDACITGEYPTRLVELHKV